MRSYTLPLGISLVIHLLPLPGVMGNAALERLYGFQIEQDGLLVALQHRAVMFGSLGAGLWIGTFVHRPSLPAAIGMTLASDISFLALAIPSWKRLSHKLKKVVYADVVSILCLLVGGAQYWKESSEK